MLKLVNIKKDYYVADTVVNALKGVSITFRESEFVSILGPSGCGKTTLLNIIGGLDHYTDGELFIDEVSTKEYKDRDWDNYRNHRIGFVFQSYNLIPHQTILENVELALTISGINKEERVSKAKNALDKVGLAGLYNKKPNQLSGGQCQRVAIARALVNDPEILLADEPTGALDTVTSIQIMDLIKEIAKDTLVIMVTHNPDLAEKYSTRIVKLLDGNVVSDSNPYDGKIIERKESKSENNSRKSKLSFWQGFRLSARNLMSKFKRTLMVCFAGSIGIIGIATVLSVSTGVQNYIHHMQEDMISSNPIVVAEETLDINALVSSASNNDKQDAITNGIEDGKVNVNRVIETLIKRSEDFKSLQKSNEITSDYVDFIKEMPEEYYSAVVFDYGLDLKNNIYTSASFKNQNTNDIPSLSVIEEIYTALLKQTEYSDYAYLISSYTDNFMQIPNNEQFIMDQYDFVTEDSRFASKENELMLVLDDNGQLSDLFLAQFGYYSQEQFFNIIYHAIEDERFDEEMYKDQIQISLDELVNKEFIWFPNDYIFLEQQIDMLKETNPFNYKPYIDIDSLTEEELEELGAIKFKIAGVLKPKEGISYGTLETGLYYTESLVNKILDVSKDSKIVNYINTSGKDITSMPLNETTGIGITYEYSFFDESEHKGLGFIGSSSMMISLLNTVLPDKMPETYILSLNNVGGKNIPSIINIYPKDFKNKDNVVNYLEKWNSDQDITLSNGKVILAQDRLEMTHTDVLSLVISLVNTMITMVTSALVAFTALSLLVSTVMIAVITYVSVMERVKEIGVIRSLGGRKKDVSRLFNAETFIIGGVSGILGILVTYIFSGIINLIVGNLSGVYTIATLPFPVALIMIIISIGLTLISGLIPARSAAKKNPVDALRSE